MTLFLNLKNHYDFLISTYVSDKEMTGNVLINLQLVNTVPSRPVYLTIYIYK